MRVPAIPLLHVLAFAMRIVQDGATRRFHRCLWNDAQRVVHHSFAALPLILFLTWFTYSCWSASAQTNLHFDAARSVSSISVARTGVWRAGKVMLPILTPTTNFTVVRHGEGTNFATLPDSTTTVSGRTHISVPTNTWSILRPTGPLAPVRLSTNITRSRDVGIVCVSPTQGVEARLFLKADDSPMPWDKQRFEYYTKVRIGFEATNVSSLPLPAVAVHLQTHNLKLEDEKNRILTLHQPGIMGSIPVSIFTEKFRTNALILASTDVGEETFLVEIQRLGLWDMIIQLCPGPTLFLVLLGAGAGGFLHFLRTVKSSRKPRKAWYWFVIEGLVAGPLTVALVVGLGIALPIGRAFGPTLASPWAWLALAAIGGYGGAVLFEGMVTKARRAG